MAFRVWGLGFKFRGQGFCGLFGLGVGGLGAPMSSDFALRMRLGQDQPFAGKTEVDLSLEEERETHPQGFKMRSFQPSRCADWQRTSKESSQP